MKWQVRLLDDDDSEIGRLTVLREHELLDLYVAKPSRDKGLAKQLVKMAEAIAKELGYPRVTATVFPENTASRKVWESAGFTPLVKYEKRYDGRSLKWADELVRTGEA